MQMFMFKIPNIKQVERNEMQQKFSGKNLKSTILVSDKTSHWDENRIFLYYLCSKCRFLKWELCYVAYYLYSFSLFGSFFFFLTTIYT